MKAIKAITVTLAAGNTPQSVLPAGALTEQVLFQADRSNLGTIVLAGPEADASSSVGIELVPGDYIAFGDSETRGTDEEFNLSDFYFDSATTGVKLRVVYVTDR